MVQFKLSCGSLSVVSQRFSPVLIQTLAKQFLLKESMDPSNNGSIRFNHSDKNDAAWDFYDSVVRSSDGSFHKLSVILLGMVFILTQVSVIFKFLFFVPIITYGLFQILGNWMLSSIIWHEMYRDRDRTLLKHLHCLLFRY